MTRVLITLATLLVALYLLFCAGLYLFQRQLLYVPQPRTLDAPGSTLELTRPEGPLQVTVQAHDGPRALLYFGGNAEDVSLNLPELRQAFPDRALYLMHYPGYGGSAGEPSEALIVRDALALFDQVQATHPQVDVVGRSLGSGVAVQVARARPVRRLVLVTPYDSIEAVAAERFPWVPVGWLLKDRYRSVDRVGALRTPSLLLVAGQDRVIPPAHAERLARHFAPGVARLEPLEGVGHNDISLHPRYWALLQEALR